MKTVSRKWLTFLSAGTLCLLLGSITTEIQPKKFAADILTTQESDFYLWYIDDSEGSQKWNISTQVGSIIELPLGISANENVQNTLPIDSVEFRIHNIPDYLVFDSVSVLPGFHVDSMASDSETLGKTDLSVFITPEFFSERDDGTPGAPIDQNEIGQLMSATSEILRVKFRIVSSVHITSPLSLEGILAVRDGDFSRFIADGNPNFPGNNPGTIEIVPDTGASGVQIVSTKAISNEKVQLEFTGSVLAGTGKNGSENPVNYYVYACDSHVPAPISTDPNATDAQACQRKQQESILDPGESISAIRNGVYSYLVTLTLPADNSFQEDAYYIVLVKNVANDTAEIAVPDDGLYSQMFQWKEHPLVSNISTQNSDSIAVQFTNAVCLANSSFGAKNTSNYSVFSCNEGTAAENCTTYNTPSVPNPTVLSAVLGANNSVILTLDNYIDGANYVVQLKNIANQNCDADSSVPLSPAYFSPMLQGSSGGVITPDTTIGLGIGGGTIHLPWRETLPLTALGGKAPFVWEVIPSDAGEIDLSSGNPVFRPALTDANGNPLHDERDVIVRVIDAENTQSEIQIHILRRGDLGGTAPLFLDKTNIQDVNDVSAGWKN